MTTAEPTAAQPPVTPPVPPAARGWDFTAPLDGATQGRLVFTSGAAGLTLEPTLDPAAVLCHARFQGRPPAVTARGGVVRAAYRWRFAWWPFDGQGASATFALSPRVPWEIEVRGGLAAFRADLRALDLRRLQVLGGAREVELVLPRPVVPGHLQVVGGASQVTVRRPEGVPVGLQLIGGASHVALDGQRLESVGGLAELGAAAGPGGEPGWTIELVGGASHLTIGTVAA
jgi:hypothetical protein